MGREAGFTWTVFLANSTLPQRQHLCSAGCCSQRCSKPFSSCPAARYCLEEPALMPAVLFSWLPSAGKYNNLTYARRTDHRKSKQWCQKREEQEVTAVTAKMSMFPVLWCERASPRSHCQDVQRWNRFKTSHLQWSYNYFSCQDCNALSMPCVRNTKLFRISWVLPKTGQQQRDPNEQKGSWRRMRYSRAGTRLFVYLLLFLWHLFMGNGREREQPYHSAIWTAPLVLPGTW